jgi:hypothetical protein
MNGAMHALSSVLGVDLLREKVDRRSGRSSCNQLKNYSLLLRYYKKYNTKGLALNLIAIEYFCHYNRLYSFEVVANN